MGGSTLTLLSPQGRPIIEFISDPQAIADSALQLQNTGEQARELDLFAQAIIEGRIEVQDGISIDALAEMVRGIGASLRPLADYFCELAERTWEYAEACQAAGNLTSHMPERVENLNASLQQIVLEEENNTDAELRTRDLDEDDEASGYLIPYTVLNEEGALAAAGAFALDGKKRDDAMRTIESHAGSLATMKENIHARNEDMLADYDAAYDDWQEAADAYIAGLDGILGILEHTEAEEAYVRLGTVADVAGGVGAAADAATLALVPFPPFAAAAATVGIMASALEGAAEGGQAIKVAEGTDGHIRVAEGQVLGEGQDAVIVTATGLVPMGDIARKAGRAVDGQEVPELNDTPVGVGGDGQQRGSVDEAHADRQPDLPVDIAVAGDDGRLSGDPAAPIAGWVPDAEETNPESVSVVPGRGLPEGVSASRGSDEESVQIPEAPTGSAPAAPGIGDIEVETDSPAADDAHAG